MSLMTEKMASRVLSRATDGQFSAEDKPPDQFIFPFRIAFIMGARWYHEYGNTAEHAIKVLYPPGDDPAHTVDMFAHLVGDVLNTAPPVDEMSLTARLVLFAESLEDEYTVPGVLYNAHRLEPLSWTETPGWPFQYVDAKDVDLPKSETEPSQDGPERPTPPAGLRW